MNLKSKPSQEGAQAMLVEIVTAETHRTNENLGADATLGDYMADAIQMLEHLVQVFHVKEN